MRKKVCIVDLGNGLEIWDGKEYWSEIEGYNGKYSVSTFGRVRNNERDRLLSGSERYKEGYMGVGLCNSKGKLKTFSVHTLVAKAFLPNPKNLPVINHRDENKKNNHVDNLEYCSAQYNIEYSQAREVEQINPKTGEVVQVFKSVNEAYRQTGIFTGGITEVCNGKRKQEGGFIWRYTGKGKASGKLGKKVRQVEVFDTKTGKVVGTFKNQTKTAEFLGVHPNTVKRCLDGIQKTCVDGKYKVRYKEDED